MIERTTWAQLQPLYRFLRQKAEDQKFIKYVEVGATFTLIAVFLFLAITPTASAISKLVGEIKSKELVVKNSKAKITSILQAQDNYSQAQGKYTILESSFPSNPNFYQAASNFSATSKQSGVSLKQIRFNINDPDEKSSKKDDNTSQYFTVSVNGTAQYNSILNFIQQVMDSRRLINIDAIQFSQIQEKNGEVIANPGDINLNISSKLFFSPIDPDEKN